MAVVHCSRVQLQVIGIKKGNKLWCKVIGYINIDTEVM